jgi:hypothetical protein
MPTVSVVIPAYNVQNFIQHSIRSVLEQTFRDFEILVINDGSTDRTAVRASRFRDPRVRVLTQANRGLAGARNSGIRASQGQYIAFLDADDCWHPEKLARHVAHLDAKPDVGVSYSQSEFIDQDGHKLGYLQVPKLNNIRASDIFLRNPVGNGSAPVVRTSTLRDIAFQAPDCALPEMWYFDQTFKQSEDVECWLRIALNTHWHFEGIGLPLTYYRVNDGGLSAHLEPQRQSWEQLVVRLAQYAPSFAAHWVPAARGYQLRYLARRAVRMGQTSAAIRLLGQALRQHPGMLREEPARTLSTAGAAALQTIVPKRLYQGIESWAMRIVGGKTDQLQWG